jgi:hypothetical protein
MSIRLLEASSGSRSGSEFREASSGSEFDLAANSGSEFSRSQFSKQVLEASSLEASSGSELWKRVLEAIFRSKFSRMILAGFSRKNVRLQNGRK